MGKLQEVNEMRDYYSQDTPDWFGKNYTPTLEDLEAKLEYDEIQLSIATDNVHRLRREIQGMKQKGEQTLSEKLIALESGFSLKHGHDDG